MQHFRQPIERRVRVGAADRLDEGGNRVVVRVAIGVIDHRLALDGFLRHRQRQMHHAVVVRGVVRTASSSAVSALRTSPSDFSARWRSASGSATTG